MSTNIFERAKEKLRNQPELVHMLFSDGHQDGHEWICRSPKRSDANKGSFSINIDKSCYHDFASDDKGSLIDLIAEIWSTDPLDAAYRILGEQNPAKNDYNSSKKTGNYTKPDGIFSAYKLQIGMIQDFARKARLVREENYQLTNLTPYIDAEGLFIFAVARYEKASQSKEVRQFFQYDEGYAWGIHNKINKRPIANLDAFLSNHRATILVVEGEKKRQLAQEYLQDLAVVCASGGAQGIYKTDWSVLIDKDVLIWPDNDEAGLDFARKLSVILHKATVLKIPAEKEKGWDIGDAIQESFDVLGLLKLRQGIDLSLNETLDDKTQVSLQEISRSSRNKRIADKLAFKDARGKRHSAPFRILGNSKEGIVYLDQAKYQKVLRLDTITKQQLNVLGGTFSADYWYYLAGGAEKKYEQTEEEQEEKGKTTRFTGKRGQLKIDAISGFLSGIALEAGNFDITNLRPTGIWKDSGRVVVASQGRVFDKEGEILSKDLDSLSYTYQATNAEFPVKNFFSAEILPAQQAEDLVRNIADSFPFKSETDAMLALGWALMSPFAATHSYRGSIHVTGPKGSGKSNLIIPLLKSLSHVAKEGGDTSIASLRKIVTENVLSPIILDEREPGTSKRAQDAYNDLQNFIRESSSDSSAKSSRVIDGKLVTSFTPITFCLASISEYFKDPATAERFAIIDLVNVPQVKRSELKQKQKWVMKFIDDNIDKILSRTMSQHSLISELIDYAHRKFVQEFKNDRNADTHLPFLCYLFAFMYDDIAKMIAGQNPALAEEFEYFIKKHAKSVVIKIVEERADDEDNAISQILTDSNLELDKDRMLISTHIASCVEGLPARKKQTENLAIKESDRLLQASGLYLDFDRKLLHIYAHSPYIKRIFKDTNTPNPKPVLKRHKLCIDSESSRYVAEVRFPAISIKNRVISYDLPAFLLEVLDFKEDDLIKMTLFEDTIQLRNHLANYKN